MHGIVFLSSFWGQQPCYMHPYWACPSCCSSMLPAVTVCAYLHSRLRQGCVLPIRGWVASMAVRLGCTTVAGGQDMCCYVVRDMIFTVAAYLRHWGLA